MEEHPEGCPGCVDCFFDWETHYEQSQLEEQQSQQDLAEQIEAAIGLASLPARNQVGRKSAIPGALKQYDTQNNWFSACHIVVLMIVGRGE